MYPARPRLARGGQDRAGDVEQVAGVDAVDRLDPGGAGPL